MREQQSAAAGWVGHVLAGHRIDALVGEGGMGVVYRATHLNLRRTVALKVLPPALAADPEYRRRFEREAAIAASLEHPAVVPIYDAGHHSGVLYLSMRFVEGDDLGAVLRREGPLGVERLCAILEPVADALDAVHEAGLVHRDVKPGNVLIARSGRSRGGRVYLCDFGIAKGPAHVGHEITTAGQYLGTLQYSSPEQIQGRWIDGRADQYGLACLAFRGLTGEVPYPHENTAAVIYAHLTADPPRPGRLRPGLPPAVDAAVARAAAKEPDRRFPSCSAFVAALREAAAPRRPAAPPRTVPGPDRGGAEPPARGPAGAAHPVPTPHRRPLPRTRTLPEPPHEATPAPAVSTPATADPAAPVIRASTAGGAADGTALVPTTGAPPDRTAPPDRVTPGRATPDRPVRPDRPAPDHTASPDGGAGGAGAPPVGGVPAPVDVHAERDGGDSSIAVTWTAGGPQEVEYKVIRLAADGRWRVVGRTRATGIIDGGTAAGTSVPVYEVVARLGSAVSAAARSAGPAPEPRAGAPEPGGPAHRAPTPPTGGAAPQPGPAPAPDPGGIPAVRELTVSSTGTLVFAWPAGVTEVMVVVRRDRPPVSPGDPAATSWKITNMRYQLDGGLVLPPSVVRPCHVAVASCRRERGALVVAPGFAPTARTTVEP